MSGEVIITAEISANLDEALTHLALVRGQSKSELVHDALKFYVQSEDDFVAAVEEGLADIRAGRLVDHEDVLREMHELLDAKR